MTTTKWCLARKSPITPMQSRVVWNGKAFDFSFYLQGVGKVAGYLEDEARHAFINDYSIPKKEHLDRWTPMNPNASYPRLYQSQEHNRLFSDYWKEDASYLRLKNIQIGYRFPAGWWHLLALIVLEYMLRQITCLLKPITSELMTLK